MKYSQLNTKFDFGTSVGSRDIAILVYVGILLSGYSVL